MKNSPTNRSSLPAKRRNASRQALIRALMILGSVVATASFAAGGPQSYAFSSIDPPDSVGTFPIGINNSGLIALQYYTADGSVHSAALKDAQYTIIDVPVATDTLASAPNMRGQVALAYYPEGDVNCHAAVYTRGEHAYLPDASGYLNTSPSAINSRGHISGTVWQESFFPVHGYLWDGEVYLIFDHPESDVFFTLAFGMNNHDQLVGQYNTSDGVIHGFLKDGDTYTEIAVPDAPNTAAFSINNSGVIIGLCGEAGEGPFGFAIGSHGFVLTKGVYTPLDYPGAVTSFPLGLNDVGEIVGVYMDETGTFHGYLATPR